MARFVAFLLALLLGASAIAPACALPQPAPSRGVHAMHHQAPATPEPCHKAADACLGCAIAAPEPAPMVAGTVAIAERAFIPLRIAGLVGRRPALPDRPPRFAA